MSNYVLLMSSYRSFIALCLIYAFRFLIWGGFFLYMSWKNVLTSLFYMWLTIFPCTICQRDLSTVCPYLFCHRLIYHNCVGFFFFFFEIPSSLTSDYTTKLQSTKQNSTGTNETHSSMNQEKKKKKQFSGRNINNLRYADDITLMAKNEEELKALLMKVKEESEKPGLKINIQKMKIMASSPITS